MAPDAAPDALGGAVDALGGAPDALAEASDKRPASKAGGRFAAAAATAVVEANPDSELTVDAVEYASKPCGAIFRFCAVSALIPLTSDPYVISSRL